MTDTTHYLTTVADWFVMKGGEVAYDINADETADGDGIDDCERPVWVAPIIHEVWLGDLQVFVGESIESFEVDTVAEVGVLLRTGIPLPEHVVEDSVAGLRAMAPGGITVEVIDGVEEGPGVSVWLVRELGRDTIESGAFGGLVDELLGFAGSEQVQSTVW